MASRRLTGATRIRRSHDIHVTLRDIPRPDIGLLLRGKVNFVTDVRFVAITPADQAEHVLSDEETMALACFEQDEWSTLQAATEGKSITDASICNLLDRGLLIADAGDVQPVNRVATGWNRYAYLYHRMSRWEVAVYGRDHEKRHGQVSTFDEGDLFEKLRARFGPPPGAFYSVMSGGQPLPLSKPQISGDLYDNLRRRETVRAFDATKPLPLESLSTLLFYTFGCHGTVRLTEDLTVLKKCSPSGGALHPIEAYPLVLNAEGIPVGLYHYSVERHALEPIEAMSERRSRALATDLVAGQSWFGSAHCLVILTARFDRSFWKYRNNSKAYKVLFLDAGHLSQTFYLLCADLGLGASFTAAINDAAIEDALGLQPDKQGPVGVCGCGIAGTDDSAMRMKPEPYPLP